MKYLITERQYRLLKEEISVDYNEFSIEVDILHDGEKIGYMIMEKEKDDEYTIVDAKIEPDYRGRGLYQKSIMELLERNPELKINSMFRSEEANFAWKSLMKKLPDYIGLREKKYDEGVLYQIYMK